MKRLAFVSLALLVLLLSSLSGTAAPIYGEPPEDSVATLSVQKSISSDDILLGESITVHVNITNWSGAYLYNLTITEPQFTSNVISSQLDYEKYTWVRLGFGASYTYSYEITPKVTGEFNMEPTTVEYVDKDGFEYRAQSAYIPFEVSEEVVIEDTDILWNNIFWLSFVLTIIPIIVYYANRIIKR